MLTKKSVLMLFFVLYVSINLYTKTLIRLEIEKKGINIIFEILIMVHYSDSNISIL